MTVPATTTATPVRLLKTAAWGIGVILSVQILLAMGALLLGAGLHAPPLVHAVALAGSLVFVLVAAVRGLSLEANGIPSREGAPPLGSKWVFAWLALAWEGVWPALMPLAMVGVGFVALALLGVLPLLGGWAHLAVLVALAAASLWALYHFVLTVRLPRGEAVMRRLERDSALTHRPLQTLQDAVPEDIRDPLAAALFRRHQQRVAQQVARLKVERPLSDVDRKDPFALRYALGLLLVVGLVYGAASWQDRLREALFPTFSATEVAVDVAFQLWVTPPDYTGESDIFPLAVKEQAEADALAAAQERANATGQPIQPPAPTTTTIPVPTGSTLRGRISGGTEAPTATVIRQDTGESTVIPFAQVDAVNWELNLGLSQDLDVSLAQGSDDLGQFLFTTRADAAPTIAFTDAPAKREGEDRIGYGWKAEDDYGLARVSSTMTLAAETIERPQDHPPLVIELPVAPGARQRLAEGVHTPDLIDHPWAGLPVTVLLSTEDGAGQTAETHAETVDLPLRPFDHPVANFIISQRQRLTTHPVSTRLEVGQLLLDISNATQDYNEDTTVYLALRFAGYRLQNQNAFPDILAIQELLWKTAIRLEDGRLGSARERLAAAERRLQRALEDPETPDEEVERLMQELEDAMAELMEEMARQMEEMWADQEMPEMPDMSQFDLENMDIQDMESMLDDFREQMEQGDREQAQQRLEEMRRMMEQMRPMTPEEMQEMLRQAQQMQQGRSLIDDLEDLADNQQALYDRTFQQSQDQQLQPIPMPDIPRMPTRLDPFPPRQPPQDIRRTLEEMERQLQADRDAMRRDRREEMTRRQLRGEAMSQGLNPLDPEVAQAIQEELAQRMEDYDRVQEALRRQRDQSQEDQQDRQPDPAQDTDHAADDTQEAPPTGPTVSGLPRLDTEGGTEGQEGLRAGLIDGSERVGGGVSLGFFQELPQELAEADSAMRRAEAALVDQDPTASLDDQLLAEQKIREAIEKLRQQQQQQQQQQGGGQQMAGQPGGGGRGGQRFMLMPRDPGRDRQGGRGDREDRPFGNGSERRDRANQDPFGRDAPPSDQGEMSTENVDVPDEAERQRAREILEELRRRAGEFQRPEIELDYIQRLLRRF